MPLRTVTATTAAILLALTTIASAQDAADATDTRTQYPALLRDSYFSVNVGFIGYAFSPAQLQPGFTVSAVTVPHVVARVALFGHEFNRYVSAQGTYMRPVHYVGYRDVNGDNALHHVWVSFGGVSLKLRAPVTRRFGIYGEGGLAITSRHGFDIGGTPAVRDTQYTSPLVGAGVEYHVTPAWELVAGALYSPGKDSEQQPHTTVASTGFRYTMRALPPERVEANRQGGYIFPANLVQLELSTGYGFGVNQFVSHTVPVFWGGNVRVDRGLALHYDRNVFHTRKVFALDVGTSGSVWRSQANQEKFFTLSVYPLFRFTFLRLKPADLWAVYSLAGPTYISQTQIDGRDTGHHFTFQDFMGLGAFVGRARNMSVGVKINHYSNGNIFTENAGVRIPITFNVGYAF